MAPWRSDLKKWGYRTTELGNTPADVATIAANGEYATATNAQKIVVNNLEFVDIQMKATGGNGSASGTLTFHWVLYNDEDNKPTHASFVSQMTLNGNTEKKISQVFKVRHRYLKLLKVVNGDASYTATAVNALVTSNG